MLKTVKIYRACLFKAKSFARNEREQAQRLSPPLHGAGSAVGLVEVGRLFADPADEFAHFGMGGDGFGSVIAFEEFTLGKEAMDFGMADAVEPDFFPATESLGNEVMFIGRRAFRERATAYGA